MKDNILLFTNLCVNRVCIYTVNSFNTQIHQSATGYRISLSPSKEINVRRLLMPEASTRGNRKYFADFMQQRNILIKPIRYFTFHILTLHFPPKIDSGKNQKVLLLLSLLSRKPHDFTRNFLVHNKSQI